MKKGFSGRIRKGIAAAALGLSVLTGYACNNGTEPKYPPVASLSAFPLSGISPLADTVKYSCVSPSNNLRSSTLYNNGNVASTKTSLDTVINLTQNASFSLKCIDNDGKTDSIGPISVQVLQPSISQTLSLQNYIDLQSNVNLQNISQATRKITKNGTAIDSLTKTITGPNYQQTLSKMPSGQYCSIVEAANVKPDTACTDVPVYAPIVYTGNVQNIYTDDSIEVTIDSVVSRNPEANPVAITGVTDLDSIVRASMNGNQMKILSGDSLGNYSIGINTTTATGATNQFVFNGKISPDIVAFSSIIPGPCDSAGVCQPPTEGDQVYIDSLNGSPSIKLTNGIQNIVPAWSPDGTKLAYFSSGGGLFSVYTMNSDGSSQTRLVQTNLNTMYPSWSPDGKKIVFSYTDYSTKSGDGVVNTNGTGFLSLYEEPYNGSEPSCLFFSPDGTKIAFETSYGQIDIMNQDGTNITQFTSTGSNGGPRWLPDGSGLLFMSNRDNPNFDIYKKTLTGIVTRLTTNVGAIDPDILQNGKKIIYAKMGSSQFYIINADGSGPVQTVTVPGLARFPTFRPRIR